MLQKQHDVVRLKTDGDDARLRGIPTNIATNCRPNFHRPFLDVEDSSPPEKLYKLHSSEVQNGICAVPVHTALLRKTSPCDSQQCSGSAVEDKADKLDDRGTSERDCGAVREDDGGRDRRLHAALGLICLADVNSDVTELQTQSSSSTAARDFANGSILF